METKKVHNQGKEKKDEINLFSHDSERILFFEKMCWRSQSPFQIAVILSVDHTERLPALMDQSLDSSVSWTMSRKRALQELSQPFRDGATRNYNITLLLE